MEHKTECLSFYLCDSPETTVSVCSEDLTSALQVNFPASLSSTLKITRSLSPINLDLSLMWLLPNAEHTCNNALYYSIIKTIKKVFLMLCKPLERVPLLKSILIIRLLPWLHSTLFLNPSMPHFKVIFCPTSVMTEFPVAKNALSTEERTKHALIRPQTLNYKRSISDSQYEVIWLEHDTNHIQLLLILQIVSKVLTSRVYIL